MAQIVEKGVIKLKKEDTTRIKNHRGLTDEEAAELSARLMRRLNRRLDKLEDMQRRYTPGTTKPVLR